MSVIFVSQELCSTLFRTKLLSDKIQPSAADAKGDGADNSANGVGDVVVGAGRMVDAIPPALGLGACLRNMSEH